MNISCEVIDAWFTGDSKYGIPALTSLNEITLGEGVKTVKENAFNGCTNIKTIDIGSTVMSIEARAFSGTDKLTNVTCRATTVPETDRTTFENSYPNYATLHVPAESVSHYKSHEVWSKFKDVVPLNGEETDIERLTMTNSTDYVPIIHNLSGQRITNLKKGLNVIRMKDGMTRKVVVK